VISRLDKLQTSQLDDAVNMLKITNALKAVAGFGFQVCLLICIFVFICSWCFTISKEAKSNQLLV